MGTHILATVSTETQSTGGGDTDPVTYSVFLGELLYPLLGGGGNPRYTKVYTEVSVFSVCVCV
ncbi:hypothetical protein AOLI_G00258550, partial [Acnodon oligacanthus]